MNPADGAVCMVLVLALAAGAVRAWRGSGSRLVPSVPTKLDLVDLALACLAAASVVWMVSASGIPALRHDWVYGPRGIDVQRQVLASLSGWTTDGLGQSNAQAGFYPIYLAFGELAAAAGPSAAFFCTYSLALAAAAVLARRAIGGITGAGDAFCTIAAAAYAFGPVAFNRIVAGHFMHLYFAAAIPAVVLLAPRASRPGRYRTAYAGLLLAVIAAMAQQVHAIAICVALALWLLAAQRAWRLCLMVVVVAALSELPSLLALTLAPGDLYGLKRAVLQWEWTQSAPPALLVAFGGYPPRYSEAYSVPSYLANTVVFAMLPIGALVARGRIAPAMIALGAFAGLIATGLRGPLAAPIAAAFVFVPAMSAIRELYDVMPLLAFAAACATAACLDTVAARFRFGRAWALAVGAGVTGAAIWPVAGGYSHDFVPLVAAAAEADAIDRLPLPGRVLLLPGIYPMATSDGKGEGLDPLAAAEGAHPIVDAWRPAAAVARTYWALASDPARAAEDLRSLGCSYIVVHHGIVRRGIDSPAETALERGAAAIGTRVASIPSLSVYELAPAPSRVRATSVLIRPGTPQEQNGGTDVAAIDDPANAPALAQLGFPQRWTFITPSRIWADPRRSPVLARDVWQQIPRVATLPGEDGVAGVGGSIVLGPGRVAGTWAGSAVPIGNDSAHVVLRRAESVDFPAAYALSGSREGTDVTQRVAGRGGSVTVTGADTADVSLVVHGMPRAVAFAERFDPAWQLSGSPGITPLHVRLNGWENGWIGSFHDGERLTIRFAAQPAIAAAEWINAALWLVLAYSVLAGFAAWRPLPAFQPARRSANPRRSTNLPERTTPESAAAQAARDSSPAAPDRAAWR